MTPTTTPTHREILAGFRLPNIKVMEFTSFEAVPFYNAAPHPDDSVRYAETPVANIAYEFEQASMVTKWLPNGEPFSVYIQAIDQYRFQREFKVEYRRVPGTSSFRWVATTYLHPFHRIDQDQDVTAGKARRFIDRLVTLIENHPSLVFNNSGQTSEAPPRLRARHEGFVRWHTLLLNGAEFTVKLLD